MTSNLGALPLLPALIASPPPLSRLRADFLAHKFLMVAVLKCLQERFPPTTAPQTRDDPAVHRWMREPSAERQVTPCIVLREHHAVGDLSVVRLSLEGLSLQDRSLASWMRSVVPPSCQPDFDTLHLAMAPTLPGVPMLVHSIGADGEAFTHMFTDGVWSHSADDQFLLRAIRDAQMVATAMPLTGAPTSTNREALEQHAAVLETDEDQAPCDLGALGRRYDHIAVHAAIKELSEFRRSQRRVRMAPRAALASSGG
jgi:hypothetical protein